MPADAEENVAYRTLDALRPEGLNDRQWALKAGLANNALYYIRKHGNPNTETIEKLLDAIGVDPLRYHEALSPVRTEVRSSATRDVRREFFGEEPLVDLPLVGTAMGGEYGELDEEIEMTELHMLEVLEYVVRPAALKNDRDAYALTIVGDSMVPRFKPNERVSVSPRSPVGKGDDVIVQLRGMDGEDERIKIVLIKELVRRSSTFVELRQYNPDLVFRIDSRRVAAIHRVRHNFF